MHHCQSLQGRFLASLEMTTWESAVFQSFSHQSLATHLKLLISLFLRAVFAIAVEFQLVVDHVESAILLDLVLHIGKK